MRRRARRGDLTFDLEADRVRRRPPRAPPRRSPRRSSGPRRSANGCGPSAATSRSGCSSTVGPAARRTSWPPRAAPHCPAAPPSCVKPQTCSSPSGTAPHAPRAEDYRRLTEIDHAVSRDRPAARGGGAVTLDAPRCCRPRPRTRRRAATRSWSGRERVRRQPRTARDPGAAHRGVGGRGGHRSARLGSRPDGPRLVRPERRACARDPAAGQRGRGHQGRQRRRRNRPGRQPYDDRGRQPGRRARPDPAGIAAGRLHGGAGAARIPCPVAGPARGAPRRVGRPPHPQPGLRPARRHPGRHHQRRRGHLSRAPVVSCYSGTLYEQQSPRRHRHRPRLAPTR